MSSESKTLQYKTNHPFNHSRLEPIKLERVETLKGRKYVTPEGNIYDSVTTFLSRFKKESMKKWEDSVGKEEADRVRNRAANRGSAFHHKAEDYLMNETVEWSRTDFVMTSLIKSSLPILNRINNIRLMESPLYSDTLKLAGTVDCFAEFDGVVSTIDFKTSTQLKDKSEIDNYFLQTTAYSIMVEERYGIVSDQLVIIIANEFLPPTIYTDFKSNWHHKLIQLTKL